MQSFKDYQGEIRKPSSVTNAKKYRKTIEWDEGSRTGKGRRPRKEVTSGHILCGGLQPNPAVGALEGNLRLRVVPTRSKGPDPSSKATLWVKAQHEGALPPPCIVRKDPRVPHTARRGA